MGWWNMADIKFPRDFYLDDVGVWRLKKEKIAELENPRPVTNEEYLKSCTTEQLAEEIYGFVWCSNELWQRLCCSGDGTDEESDLKIVREWLKQPHKDGES